MVKILFVCHGNICRSPMAEFIMKRLASVYGCEDKVEVASVAVSNEETGNDIYPPAKRILLEHNIPFDRRRARRITLEDYRYYDYIVCMDRSNVRFLKYILGEDTLSKVTLLMSWTGTERDVADPWYTDDFETAYADIFQGCQAMLKRVML